MNLTTDQALAQAQHVEPLDLAARLRYMEAKRDMCDGADLDAWNEAVQLTRNGVADERPILTYDSVGKKLPNGATILALSARRAHEWVILAQIEPSQEGQYVTWRCNRPGDGADTRWGHYFGSHGEALADYKER